MARKRLSKKQRILNALERGRTLSRSSILTQFNCYEGPARISELKKAGHPIESVRKLWRGEMRTFYKMATV